MALHICIPGVLFPGLLLTVSLTLTVSVETNFGVYALGSPLNYMARCAGGWQLMSLPLPFVGDSAANISCRDDGDWNGLCAAGGPYLAVAGAGQAEIDGLYVLDPDPMNHTHQRYTMGSYTLMWEPGPPEVYGERWLLIGPDGLLYQKYTPDDYLGWRGTQTHGAWSASSGEMPPPIIYSSQPDIQLEVTAAGRNASWGVYTRQAGPGKVFVNGLYSIAWQPGPPISVGERWTIFSSSYRSEMSTRHQITTDHRTHYYRLSNDSEHGFAGTWSTDWGIYPPPDIKLAQTVACFRCPVGSFSSPGATSCERCPSGFYSLSGADACTACSTGKFANSGPPVLSEAKIGACSTRRYSSAGRGSCSIPANGASTCTKCPSGRYSLHAAGKCEDCQPGKFGPTAGGICWNCPAGRWSGPRSNTCILCPAGSFQDNATGGLSPADCTPCIPGRYGASAGSTQCTDCQPGEYSPNSGSATCRTCAQGSFVMDKGATKCDVCQNKAVGPGASACELV